MVETFKFECHLCHKIVATAELVEGLCSECQNYLTPTFLRIQDKPRKPYLIKGGKDGHDKRV